MVALTGLTPAMTYNVFVKARCGATGQSNRSSMVTFSTPAIPATVPCFCGFEDATENNNGLTIAGAGVNHFVIGSDTNAVRSGANALYAADASGACTYATGSAAKTFAYRPVQMPAGTCIVNFDRSCTGGESTWDFGSVMIVPVEEPLVGGMGDSFSNIDWPNYIKRCEPDDKQFFNLTPGQNNYSGALTVAGAGTYAYGDTATLTATANTGYHFVGWNDSDTHATRQVVVTGDATYTATFAQDVVIPEDSLVVILAVNDSTMGTTNPAAGTYVFHVGDTAQAEAIPAAGFHFVNWSITGVGTPVTDNLIMMVVDSTMINQTVTVTANFAQDSVIPTTYTITLDVNDTTMGYVTGAGEYAEGAVAVIAAVAYDGFRFVNWSDGDINATRTISVGCDLSFTANFAADSTAMLVVVADETMGHVLINGEAVADNMFEGMLGDTVTIEAVANDGYHFVAWNDGDTNAVRIVVLDSAVVRLVAEFAQNVSIDDVETAEYTICTVSNRIVVRGAEQQPVYVFDVVGRLVAMTNAAAVEQSFTMSHTGIYLVKVANSAAKRVVIR